MQWSKFFFLNNFYTSVFEHFDKPRLRAIQSTYKKYRLSGKFGPWPWFHIIDETGITRCWSRLVIDITGR